VIRRAGIALLAAALLVTAARAEDAQLAALFARQGVDGTLVIASESGSGGWTHDERRAQTRLSPASTFKIFNTLIAVDQGVIEGKDVILRWDGTQYDFPDWNRDQTLQSAFRVSCVWCYQRLAAQIGAERYRRELHQAGYGKLAEPFEATTFWLDGSLEVSAVEQIALLQAIHAHRLDFSAHSYDTLRAVMLEEATPQTRLYAKTGWAARSQPQVGWYVGYVERDGAVWFFALNIDIRQETDLPLRKRIVREALQLKGILP